MILGGWQKYQEAIRRERKRETGDNASGKIQSRVTIKLKRRQQGLFGWLSPPPRCPLTSQFNKKPSSSPGRQVYIYTPFLLPFFKAQ